MHLQQAYREYPRLKEIDRELRLTMVQLMANALRTGEDPSAVIEEIREQNLALQREREWIIDVAEYEDGFRMLSSVEDVVFTEAIIMQSRFDNSKVYVKMTTNDNRYLNAYLDYSVSARPGEKLDIKTIRYKKMYLKNSEKEAIVLKGQVLSA